jgi:hypothetical protein
MKIFKNEDGRPIFWLKDAAIIFLSIIIAVLLVKTGVLGDLLATAGGFKFFGSFIAGIFFTSIFTTAPATVTLGEIARVEPLWPTVFLGGAGAALGDLLIFGFVKDSLSRNLSALINHFPSRRLRHVFRLKFFRWFIAFLGALVVASPLPDELGLAMMGLSKMKNSVFIPLSFLIDSFGVLIVCLIARSL